MAFIPSIKPPLKADMPDYWFIFSKHKLLVKMDRDKILIPTSRDIADYGLKPENQVYLGRLDDHPCYGAGIKGDLEQLPQLGFHSIRELFGLLSDDVWSAAGYGLHLTHWNENHRYCSRCGEPMEDKKDERAKICPKCHAMKFPRINPCIIVAVIKGNKILLARSSRFPNRKLYSVLAGYVEPGETLEGCVQREVKEEVNVEVTHIRYFGSQPWPFSRSLMVGFTAEYAGGQIQIDGREIVDAGWYAADALPEVPGWGSIAGRLIDWFVKSK